ncbi:hypothetical protein PHET_11977, partial [Paragonimus heterotremus]
VYPKLHLTCSSVFSAFQIVAAFEFAFFASTGSTMPQNEHIELHRKRHGFRYDYFERKRKKEAREPHERSAKAKKLRGIKAKLANRERFKEKVQMKKTIRMHELKKTKQNVGDAGGSGEKPAYLLDRDEQVSAKVLSNTVKQKRAEKAVRLHRGTSISFSPFFKISSVVYDSPFGTAPWVYQLSAASIGGCDLFPQSSTSFYPWLKSLVCCWPHYPLYCINGQTTSHPVMRHRIDCV